MTLEETGPADLDVKDGLASNDRMRSEFPCRWLSEEYASERLFSTVSYGIVAQLAEILSMEILLKFAGDGGDLSPVVSIAWGIKFPLLATDQRHTPSDV